MTNDLIERLEERKKLKYMAPSKMDPYQLACGAMKAQFVLAISAAHALPLDVVMSEVKS